MNIDVRRPACGPHNGIGNIFRLQRRNVLVHLRRSLLVPTKTHSTEIRLDHSGSTEVTRTGVPIRSILSPSLMDFSAALVAQYTAPFAYVIYAAVEPRLITW